MGDPATLAEFLQFGEENYKPDRRIIYFWNHGGLGGVCYHDHYNVYLKENKRPIKAGLTYDQLQEFFTGYEESEKDKFEIEEYADPLFYNELTQAFASVYGNSLENKPFELMFFNACLTGSYELANSVSNFSHYMLGAEPSIYDTPTREWISALAKNPSMNGAQIGKVICDSAMKNYSDNMRTTHIFSVIDLDKMPQLRTAYEAYFDEALNRSDEKDFLGAFSRAVHARNVDKYSNMYTDLGLLAENTKSLMPKTSADLIAAIDNAVVYSKRGEYLKSKGISTYYPFISKEGSNPELAISSTSAGFKLVAGQNSSYQSQKVLYNKLLNMKDMSALQGNNSVTIELNKNDHFVATLTHEQLENISSVNSLLIPVTNNKFGGAILISADNLKIDWNKGTVTENFRPVEPMFDGHRIVMFPFVSGQKNTLYRVPIIYQEVYKRDLIVSYDTSKNTYSIIGFGFDVENGVVRKIRGKLEPGATITPIYLEVSYDPSAEFVGFELNEKTGEVVKEKGKPKYFQSLVSAVHNPQTNRTVYYKWVKGTPFVYTKDAKITNNPIINGSFFYYFDFLSLNGSSNTISSPGAIVVNNGKIFKASTFDLEWMMAQMSANEQ